MFVDPREQFETRHTGHFQIENHDVWKWECRPVCEWFFGGQIGDGVKAIAGHLDFCIDPVLLDRALQQQRIIRVIFHQEDSERVFHSGVTLNLSDVLRFKRAWQNKSFPEQARESALEFQCEEVMLGSMPTIKISVPHQLGAEEAKRRITQLITETKAQFGQHVSDVQESWNGNQGNFGFKARGFNVSGNLQVEPTLANMEIHLPFAALPFKSRIEQEISTRARQLLS